jgi:hypothetical protein
LKSPTRPVDNVVIATKGIQDRNINTQAGMTVENKGKLILTRLVSSKLSFSITLNGFELQVLPI